MLSPVSNIKFNKINTLKKTNKTQENISSNPYKIDSIYSNSINFKGYYNINQRPSFEKTVQDNYFQLKTITLPDGKKYTFKPDDSQVEAARVIYDNKNLLLNAPTGIGKTAIINYTITKNLKEGKKTYIPMPLKALTNDKCREFTEIYGKDNVGILTGDIKLNTNAPIVLMTTEIYNAMTQEIQENTMEGSVVFDEAHYLGDYDRGNVWEYSIMNTPMDKLQMVLLSATIGNSEQLTNWISSLSPTRETQEVKVEVSERYVPLNYFVYAPPKDKNSKESPFKNVIDGNINFNDINIENLTPKQKRAFEVIYKNQNHIEGFYPVENKDIKQIAQEFLANFQSNGKKTISSIGGFRILLKEKYPTLSQEENEVITQLLLNYDSRKIKNIQPPYFNSDYSKLVSELKNENKLPALIFKLSVRGCDDIIQELKYKKVDLTTKDEKEEIKNIIQQYKDKGIYLGNHFDEECLLRGFAAHNASVIPTYKKLVEDLYSKKLIKVVAATSTLSAGINMPTKTVVMTDVTHPEYNIEKQEMSHLPLSANEFHQMTGRAGRRGIDNIGNVILYNLKTNKESKIAGKANELQYAYDLIMAGANDIKSFIRPDWVDLANNYANLLGDDGINYTIEKTFKMFNSQNSDKDRVILAKKFDKYKKVMAKLGYTTEGKEGNVHLTPKGRILKRSQSVNPLLLSTLITDEKLKDIDVFELCQIVGHIAGSSEKEEHEFMPILIYNQLKAILPGDEDKKVEAEHFADVYEKMFKTEYKTLRPLKEQKINPAQMMKSSRFGGYITYAFARLNDSNSDTTGNFKLLTDIIVKPDSGSDRKVAYSEDEFNRENREGEVYSTLAQSCSILKRIQSICEYALQYPEDYNQEYYSKLKEISELALLYLKQKPIYDELAL